VLDVNFVNAGDDVERDSPIGRFFESRPETSNFGEFASAQATLQLTDAVSFAGSTVYDTDDDQVAAGSTGVLLDHGFGFSSFAEVRRIGEPVDSTFVNTGVAYAFSPRYALAGRADFDVESSDIQTLGVQIRRDAAQWRLELGVDFDDTLNDTQLSVRFRPKGLQEDRVRGAFTRDRDYPDLDQTGQTALFGPER